MMKRVLAAMLLAMLSAQSVLADDKHHTGNLTEGEIRKVDKDAKKITIKHDPIQNLDMPPMTMVFQVQDPALLDRVKAGDRVRFSAVKLDGGYAVTRIEVEK